MIGNERGFGRDDPADPRKKKWRGTDFPLDPRAAWPDNTLYWFSGKSPGAFLQKVRMIR
jgi:hypothetical protein